MSSVLLSNPFRIARLESLLNYIAVHGSVVYNRLTEDVQEVAEILMNQRKVRVTRNDWGEVILHNINDYYFDSSVWPRATIHPLVLDMAKEHPDNEWHLLVYRKNS